LTFSSYDLLGYTASYVPIEGVLMMAGVGGVPSFVNKAFTRTTESNSFPYSGYTLGLKLGLPVSDKVDVALGYQMGSGFDRRDPPITNSDGIFSAPYAALSWGDNDRRLSFTLGFSHNMQVKEKLSFRDALGFGVLGGDYRIGWHEKIAFETGLVESLAVLPFIVTGRLFYSGVAVFNNVSLDFGIGYMGWVVRDGIIPGPKFLPVVAFSWTP
jgi:hypothetical protein